MPASTRDPHLRPGVAVALVLAGLALAAVPTLMAGFTICGISGCSGGGFGRSTDPGTTLALLVVSGVVAALPLATHALRRRSARIGAGAMLLALVVSVLAGWLIGSDLRGCPRNVDTETCLQETSRVD